MSIKLFDSPPRRRTAAVGAACGKTSVAKKTLCFTSGVVWGHHLRLSAKGMTKYLQIGLAIGSLHAGAKRDERQTCKPPR